MYEYLLGVGTPKAGTTLLYDLLQKHPQIQHGTGKELHYFDYAEQPNKAEYDALFSVGHGLKMDITPMYMCRDVCIDGITRILDPRKTAVVVLLRDPVERALSHYRMCLSQGLEKRTLDEAFKEEPQMAYPRVHDLRRRGYFSVSLYAPQLERVYRSFPRENIRVWLFEDFVGHQQAYVDELCDFVGIQRIAVKDMHSNKTVVHVKSQLLAKVIWRLTCLTPAWLKKDWMRKLKYRLTAANERKDVQDALDPALERRLVDYYRQDVETLRTQYGIDVTRWRHFA